MVLIPVEVDGKTLAHRFRKADAFAFLNEDHIHVEENPHKTSKSPEFFDYFKTLNVTKLYVKELGYKTFLTLLNMGVEVFLVQNAERLDDIETNTLLLLTKENAKVDCSLGHHSKESL